MTERNLSADFEKLLNALLFLFSEPVPTVRAKVVKTFSTLTKLDPNLISRDLVRESVTERLNDIAISVREEAVKLVGGFVLLGTNVYH